MSKRRLYVLCEIVFVVTVFLFCVDIVLFFRKHKSLYLKKFFVTPALEKIWMNHSKFGYSHGFYENE